MTAKPRRKRAAARKSRSKTEEKVYQFDPGTIHVTRPAPPPEPPKPEIATVYRSVRFPKDWREAVKERFAPGWVLARWPVVYEERKWTEEVSIDGTPVPVVTRGLIRVSEGVKAGDLLAALRTPEGCYSHTTVKITPTR